ncbi:MAG TPA: nitronate monooxygenase [Gemmatimonadaceae bacterium]|nr:nitronate monooxygenase [Gemmatimonadaceae bacterium]
MRTPLTDHAGIAVPLICGAMYPCSNPELVGAVSAAGGIGIIQPVSLTFVHGYDFREGVRLTQKLAQGKPVGFNALIEESSAYYRERMRKWIDIALEEGIRFFITSLGKPRWVVDRVSQVGGVVYHDVTERKWADKGKDAGVHGLIAVNDRAGGHAGPRSAAELLDELRPLGLPVVCAGGIGTPDEFRRALQMGYAGAQLGTRFIATPECSAHPDYKQAIVTSTAQNIVHTERLTGVPVAVINNAYVRHLGTRAGPIARWMLRHRKMKHWMRTIYAVRSLYRLKKDLYKGRDAEEYWQAGKSVDGIHGVEPAGEIVRKFAEALSRAT